LLYFKFKSNVFKLKALTFETWLFEVQRFYRILNIWCKNICDNFSQLINKNPAGLEPAVSAGERPQQS